MFQSPMEVKIKQVEGLTFVGKGDTDHWVTIDGPEKFGGSESASRPMEFLLISLGSCTGSDVASILKKKRIEPVKFEINLKGKIEEEHPKVFKKIKIKYVFYGNIDKKSIEKAIDLSQNKYCPVVSMLKKAGVEIKYSYKIIE